MDREKFRLKLTSIDYSPADESEEGEAAAPELTEYITDAELVLGDSCEIIYRENEDLGMGNTTVKVCWKADEPERVTVMRSGEVGTVMTFEPGKRHISAYSMPGMSFELCTRALRVINNFDGKIGGEIYLDYVIEIRGSFGGRRKMIMQMLPD